MAEMNEAIRLALEDVRCYAGRGMVWELAKGELREASLDLDEAVRLDPKDAEVLSWRAGLWAMKDEPDKAFADCDGAIRLNPHLAEAYACRGAVLAEKQETDKAIADLDRAIRLKSRLAEAFVIRSTAWLEKGEFDKAIADSSEAIRLDPQMAEAFDLRGSAWYAKKEYDRAFADFTEAIIRLEPRDLSAYYHRADVWEARGEHYKAIADLADPLYRLDPPSMHPPSPYRVNLGVEGRDGNARGPSLDSNGPARRKAPTIDDFVDDFSKIGSAPVPIQPRGGRATVASATRTPARSPDGTTRTRSTRWRRRLSSRGPRHGREMA